MINPYSSIIQIVCQGKNMSTFRAREKGADGQPTASVQHKVEFILNLGGGDTHAPGCLQISLCLEL